MIARRFALLAAFVWMAAAPFSPASAQSREIELAGQIVDILDLPRSIQEGMAEMVPVLAENMSNSLRLSPAEAGRLHEILLEECRSGGPELRAGIAQVYADRMTEAQLSDTLDFLRSPAGAEFADVQINGKDALRVVGQSFGGQLGARSVGRFMAERSATPSP